MFFDDLMQKAMNFNDVASYMSKDDAVSKLIILI